MTGLALAVFAVALAVFVEFTLTFFASALFALAVSGPGQGRYGEQSGHQGHDLQL
jgi:hypothetical protein